MDIVLNALKKFFSFTNSYIAPSWLWLGILYYFVQFIGYAPYNIRFEKVTKITPFIQQFPGQKIRLGVDPQNETDRKDINDVVWEIYKDGKRIDMPNLNGFFPTIKLPPKGGIYSLRASAKIQGKPQESNLLNFYITQDDSATVTIKFSKPTTIPLKQLISSNIKQSQNVEVLNIDDHWSPVEIGKDNDANFAKGTQIKAIEGKIFMRSKPQAGGAYERYDAIELNALPNDSYEQQHIQKEGFDKK